MSSLDDHLLEVFQAVFPEVATSDMVGVSAGCLEAWDSLATVTLVNLLEEEFDLEIPPDEAMDVLSFEAFRGYLAKRGVR